MISKVFLPRTSASFQTVLPLCAITPPSSTAGSVYRIIPVPPLFDRHLYRPGEHFGPGNSGRRFRVFYVTGPRWRVCNTQSCRPAGRRVWRRDPVCVHVRKLARWKRARRATPGFLIVTICFSYFSAAVGGDFPLAVSASLTDRPPFKPGDSKTAAAYISFFILTWNIAFFPMGGSLLIASDYKHTKKGLPVDCVTAAEPQTTPPHSGGEAVIQEKSEGAAVAMCSAGVPQFADVENGVLSDSNRRRADEQRPSNTDAKIFPRLAALAKRGLLQTCTAANVGLVLGLAVGVTPPLRKIVVDDGSNSAPLAFLLEAAKFMGDGAVPLALISAGATLSKLNAGTSRPMIVALIAAFRLLVCPAIAIFGTVCLARAGLVDENDKVLLYVISFMGCTPSATSNLFITQLYNNGDVSKNEAPIRPSRDAFPRPFRH
ncbi:MAG: hypothetical protein BJ554DRAFT_2331 [Olpidium bornovanus]|uniref:PIN-like protein n=1 Tax=Olpidium bornovanus TaxID=278681 RepID=A0A8H7ZR20_9FUNG|nr:MAG: hypothetical protein BJ554DRAFT_2331 [Olpidium bornovanus]